jgi:hypothetical protein
MKTIMFFILKVNSYEKVILKSTSYFIRGILVTFYLNLHIRNRSQAKKTSATPLSKCCRSTGAGGAATYWWSRSRSPSF